MFMLIEKGVSGIIAFFALVYLQDVNKFPFILNLIISLILFILIVAFFIWIFEEKN